MDPRKDDMKTFDPTKDDKPCIHCGDMTFIGGKNSERLHRFTFWRKCSVRTESPEGEIAEERKRG